MGLRVIKPLRREYSRTRVEDDPTCPGGGKMKWTVNVEEPGEGAIYAFVGIEEGSTDHDEKDAIVLDVESAKWLYKTLGEAIEVAAASEKKAQARTIS